MKACVKPMRLFQKPPPSQQKKAQKVTFEDFISRNGIAGSI
jgi:hypothetical protein